MFVTSASFNDVLRWTLAIGLLVLLAGASPSVGSGAAPAAPASTGVADPVPFEDLFTPVRSIRIEGTEDHPLFDLRDIAVQGDTLFVLDKQGATLSAFRLDGTLLYQVGRPGRGPGELTNPERVELISDDRLVVLEGPPNSRLQTFSARDGQLLNVFTEGVHVRSSTRDAYVDVRQGTPHLVSSTSAPCGSEDALCVVQEHDLHSGALVRRFAPRRIVDPALRHITPYLMGRDASGRTYVAHSVGASVAIFDQEGAFRNRFSISQSPTFRPLDASSLPDRQLSDALAPLSYSIIHHLAVVDGDIVLDHYFKTPEGMEGYYVSVFGSDGRHIGSTSALPTPPNDGVGLLLETRGNRFFYYTMDSESELGSYTIYEYRYTGVPK